MSDAVIDIDADDVAGAPPSALAGLKRKSAAEIKEPPNKKPSKTATELSIEGATKRWHAVMIHKPYLRKTDEAREAYIAECTASPDGKSGSIICEWCPGEMPGQPKTISVGAASTGNLTHHETSAAHKKIAERKLREATALAVGNLHSFAAGLESAATKAARLAKERTLRALMHAAFVSYGVAPSNLHNVIGVDSEPFLAAQELARRGVPGIGVTTTAREDLKDAYTLLVEELKKAVEGTQGSIISDAGTLLSSKGVCILYNSGSVGFPVLLDVCMPQSLDEEGDLVAYDYVKCAEDVRAAAALLCIDIGKQVS